MFGRFVDSRELVWHFARLDWGTFRTDAVDLYLPLFLWSRDDDEVAYLVYVVRNDEVGCQQTRKFSRLLPLPPRPHRLPLLHPLLLRLLRQGLLHPLLLLHLGPLRPPHQHPLPLLHRHRFLRLQHHFRHRLSHSLSFAFWLRRAHLPPSAWFP